MNFGALCGDCGRGWPALTSWHRTAAVGLQWAVVTAVLQHCRLPRGYHSDIPSKMVPRSHASSHSTLVTLLGSGHRKVKEYCR